MRLQHLSLIATLVFVVSCGSVNFTAVKSNQFNSSNGTQDPQGGGNGDPGDTGGNGNPVVTLTTDSFAVPALPQIDILFVIDNSGSMAGEQTILANSFSNFISSFIVKNLDFHIGVVSTDVSQSGAGRLISKSSEKYLTNSSPNLVSQFQANAKLGTNGSGAEQGLESMFLSLDPSLISASGYNAGFIRPNALLSVIIVSDEDEDISNGETISQRINRTVGRVQNLKGNNFRMDFFINLSAPVQNNTYPNGNLPYPKVYLQAASQLGSTPINVESDFSAPLSKLGDDIASQMVSQFVLKNIPLDPSSIIVKINGVVVPQDSIDGWTYDSATNKIVLHGSYINAAAGNTVSIDYAY